MLRKTQVKQEKNNKFQEHSYFISLYFYSYVYINVKKKRLSSFFHIFCWLLPLWERLFPQYPVVYFLSILYLMTLLAFCLSGLFGCNLLLNALHFHKTYNLLLLGIALWDYQDRILQGGQLLCR